MFETGMVRNEAQMVVSSLILEDHVSHISVNSMVKAKFCGHGDPVGLVHATFPTLCIDLTCRPWSSADIIWVDEMKQNEKKRFKQKICMNQFGFLINFSSSSLRDGSKENQSGVKETNDDGKRWGSEVGQWSVTGMNLRHSGN